MPTMRLFHRQSRIQPPRTTARPLLTTKRILRGAKGLQSNCLHPADSPLMLTWHMGFVDPQNPSSSDPVLTQEIFIPRTLGFAQLHLGQYFPSMKTSHQCGVCFVCQFSEIYKICCLPASSVSVYSLPQCFYLVHLRST